MGVPIRAAIVGTGGIARQHAEALAAPPGEAADVGPGSPIHDRMGGDGARWPAVPGVAR